MSLEHTPDNDDCRPVRRVAAIRDFELLCQQIRLRPRLAIDTEFIAEDSYQPNLCLIQVAFDDELVVIDPFPLGSVRKFWEALVEGNVETVVHAGRVDLQFCREATGRCPKRIFDVQIAAGFTGQDYPAGLANILQKYVHINVTKHETRTDWRRRPLSDRQIEYALNDVRYLLAVRDRLEVELKTLGRYEWFTEEVSRQYTEFQNDDSEQWRRLAGCAGFSRRELAILRELWLWREEEAARRNLPPRRILRDDLVIELARRGSGDPKRIFAVRGMTGREIQRHVPEIAARIQRALNSPRESWPELTNRLGTTQSPILGQFLYAALSSLCRKERIAVGLVGGTNDLREWFSHYISGQEGPPPLLAKGWRASLIGDTLEKLLSGTVGLRIHNCFEENPLELVRLPDSPGASICQTVPVENGVLTPPESTTQPMMESDCVNLPERNQREEPFEIP
ncbi:MAG: ribonuclease D [Thermogutta sp.]